MYDELFHHHISNFACLQMIGSGAAARLIKNRCDSVFKQLAFATHSAMVGVFIASLRSVGGTNLMKTAWCIAVVSGGFSAFAVCFPRQKILFISNDLAFVTKLVSVGLTAVTMQLPILRCFQSLLLSGFLLYNTHLMIKRAKCTPIHGENQFDPMDNAMSIYGGAMMIISVPEYIWQTKNVLNRRGTFALLTLNEPILVDLTLMRSLFYEG